MNDRGAVASRARQLAPTDDRAASFSSEHGENRSAAPAIRDQSGNPSVPGSAFPKFHCHFLRAARCLERFQAKWTPVRVKKTRQIKNLEPCCDSPETERALGSAGDSLACGIQRRRA